MIEKYVNTEQLFNLCGGHGVIYLSYDLFSPPPLPLKNKTPPNWTAPPPPIEKRNPLPGNDP